MLTSAGLREVRVGVGARMTGDPFTALWPREQKCNHEDTKTRRLVQAELDGLMAK